MRSISTKTGDGGETSLLSGERVKKSDPRIHFVGTLDELNSHIGLIRSQGADQLVSSGILEQVQKDLFEIGAGKVPQISQLEAELEGIESQLPPFAISQPPL
jgi:cob(I)alamin adenosyltransferase